MYLLQHYKIDFEKVKTTEDVIRILKAFDVAFEQYNEGVKEIQDLVILVDKKGGQAVMD